MKMKYGAVPTVCWQKPLNITEQKSHERRKLALCVHIKTVHWQGREMRAEWPFRGRRLAHGGSYEELPCQEPEHVVCVILNPIQFHLMFLFFQTYYFSCKHWSSHPVELQIIYRDVKQAYCYFRQFQNWTNVYFFPLFHRAFWFIKLYSHQLMHFSHTYMYGSFKLIKST